MTLVRIVDTTGHPGGCPDMPRLTDPLRDKRAPFTGLLPRLQTAATMRAIFLRQSDSAVWTDTWLFDSDLNLSADTVIPYPANWTGEDTSWEAVLLTANGFTLVPV